MKITENGKLVLNFLAGEETELLGKEIAEGVFTLSPRQVTGVLNGLFKNDLVQKTESTPRKYSITDFGRDLVESKFEGVES